MGRQDCSRAVWADYEALMATCFTELRPPKSPITCVEAITAFSSEAVTACSQPGGGFQFSMGRDKKTARWRGLRIWCSREHECQQADFCIQKAISISTYRIFMENRTVPRKPVLMSGAIAFAGGT